MKENAGYIQFKNNDKLTAEIAINMSIPSPTSHFIFGIFCIAINAVTNIIIMMITTVFKKERKSCHMSLIHSGCALVNCI